MPVSAVTPPSAQTFIASVSVATPPTVSTTPTSTPKSSPPREPLFVAPSLSTPPANPLSGSAAAVKAANAYIDIPARANYARAAQYLKDRSVGVLSSESSFRPNQALTRREAVLYLA
jgi:hypothetical protein